MKMKRIIAALLVLAVSLAAFSACSDSKASNNDVSMSSLAAAPVNDVDAEKEKRLSELDKYEVDIDLTTLNSTMLQARVNEIINNSQDYKGKTVRLRGAYNQSYYEQTKQYYHYIIGYDETMCCAAWNIEFLGKNLPEKIEPLTTIEVVGTFDFYDELGQTYFYINVEHFAV